MPKMIRARKVPMTPAEEKRILYYLANSEELTMDQIAQIFHRDVRFISRLARKHGIRRMKRLAIG